MIRFRKDAINSLQSPELLDQPLPVLRPSSWALLLGLLIFSGAAAVWSVVGSVPVRIQGRGVLLRPESLIPVQSRGSGPILEIIAHERECVNAGQVMARIDLVQLRVSLVASRRRVIQLRHQNEMAKLQAKRELGLAREDLDRLLPYRSTGAITEQTFIDKEREVQRVESQQLAESNQRIQNINDQVLGLAREEEEFQHNSMIVAPVDGCVVEQIVQPGSVVNPGSTLFSLERKDRRGELVSLAYFPSQDGKRLKVGQTVRITPTTTKAQRHGGIQGKILSIRPLPVTREGLLQRLGLETLVDAVQPRSNSQSSNEPLIEATTSLMHNPRTRSGFDWGGGPGPDIRLTPGTITEVSVNVEGRQPISYIIPLLRDMSGIY